MTKNFLLFAVLLFILFGCISSRPPICEQTSSHIRPQTNVAENILGQEILWRQEDFPILVTISPNMRETISSSPSYQPFVINDLANSQDDKATWITGVLIMDDNLNVIMRTNLAQPLLKKSGEKFLFKVKMDF